MLFSEYKDKIKNDIFLDYYGRLLELQWAEDKFKTGTIGEWNSLSWQGFYQFLDNNLEVNNWMYVNNPSSAFWGLWWHFKPWMNHYAYLQIEQGEPLYKTL